MPMKVPACPILGNTETFTVSRRGATAAGAGVVAAGASTAATGGGAAAGAAPGPVEGALPAHATIDSAHATGPIHEQNRRLMLSSSAAIPTMWSYPRRDAASRPRHAHSTPNAFVRAPWLGVRAVAAA